METMRIKTTLCNLCTLSAIAWSLPWLQSSTAAEKDKQIAKGPLKVFILAGQSNMDGQAQIRTIDFLAEDPDPARAALLKTFKPELHPTACTAASSNEVGPSINASTFEVMRTSRSK